MGPKLTVTKDYSIFEMHEFNRNIHKTKKLEASLKRHGWLSRYPAACVQGKNGKVKIEDGHHRFDLAKRLGIAVWYVIASAGDTTPAEIQFTGLVWSAQDYADAHAKSGKSEYIELLRFKKAHGLTLGASISLLAGETPGSGNKVTALKLGELKLSEDRRYAKSVVRITDRCRDHGLGFGTSSAFVGAIGRCLRVPEFDPDILLHRLDLYASNLRKQGTVDEYLNQIEALYNYMAKGKRLPLAFRAREISRQRKEA